MRFGCVEELRSTQVDYGSIREQLSTLTVVREL